MPKLSKIVIVEDDPDIQAIARLSLEEVGGYGVEAFDTGAAAVEYARKQKPELVILDVMMPGMDGPATLAELRKLESARDVPVIFMTAKAQGAEAESLRKLGAIGVIPKPFDPMTLAQAVRELWDKHMEKQHGQ
jgi:CheY-like chemotaxis protein